MQSLEIQPCPSLRPYVRLFWVLEMDGPGPRSWPERISPDGLLELVFHYRTPMASRHDGEPFSLQARSVAVSQTRRFVEIRPGGPAGLISVRFQPWGACHFFRPPLSEISDRHVPLEALWGREAREIQERLAEAAGAGERVAILEEVLLGRLRRHAKEDVEPLVRAVWSHRGRAPVSRLREELGVGERRLQRTFAAALGTSPKGFARLTRFLHACGLLRSGPRRSQPEIALECGYYDQSHFIAEFRAFSGLTPRQFARAANVSFLDVP